MSRWHPDDPAGRRMLRKAEKWRLIQHPAIIDEGLDSERAFAPNVMTLEDLKQRRAALAEVDPTERLWHAQFQNDPQPDAIGLFGNPVRYGVLPAFGRYVIGIDLAYSVETTADYFAMVVIRIWEGVAYVVNVLRERRDLDLATHRIKFAERMYPGAAIYSYVAGPEKGAIQYLNDRGVHAQPMPARYDKGTRARKTIDAWNLGRIMVPEHAPWASGFVSRCRLFTGNPKAADDDEIDALVSACDGGLFCSGAAPKAFGKPRIGRY
jgi:predicted phage terminase large subunit-like protein